MTGILKPQIWVQQYIVKGGLCSSSVAPSNCVKGLRLWEQIYTINWITPRPLRSLDFIGSNPLPPHILLTNYVMRQNYPSCRRRNTARKQLQALQVSQRKSHQARSCTVHQGRAADSS